MNNYDEITFQEIKAIVERRFTRRMKFIRRFLIGFFLAIFIVIAGHLAFDQAQWNQRNGQMTWNEFLQYLQTIEWITVVLITGLIGWAGLAFFEMLIGNAKDRTLRREIDEERKWRMRQWQTGMYGDVPPPSYLLTDDGEIEEEYYQDKRKRIEM